MIISSPTRAPIILQIAPVSDNDTGDFDVTISDLGPLESPFCGEDDDLGSATGLVATGSTSGQGNDFGTCSSSSDYAYLWQAQQWNLRFQNGLFGFDTKLAIRYPTCDQISCDDDSGIDRASRISRYVSEGEYLVIIIEGYGGATGSYRLYITPP